MTFAVCPTCQVGTYDDGKAALLARIGDLICEREALAERALTAEERLERVTHERDQERKVFEQAMAEALADSARSVITRLRGTVCSFAVGGEMVMVPGEQVAAMLEGFTAP